MSGRVPTRRRAVIALRSTRPRRCRRRSSQRLHPVSPQPTDQDPIEPQSLLGAIHGRARLIFAQGDLLVEGRTTQVGQLARHAAEPVQERLVRVYPPSMTSCARRTARFHRRRASADRISPAIASGLRSHYHVPSGRSIRVVLSSPRAREDLAQAYRRIAGDDKAAGPRAQVWALSTFEQPSTIRELHGVRRSRSHPL